MLISTFSYTEADLATMKDLFMMFNIAESLSTLRYVLRYLQWDHGVKALDFIRRLNTILSQSPADYPVTNFVMRYFVANNFSLPGGWGPFYQEIARFIEKQFSIPAHDELAAILKFNERVMPDDTQRYPLEVDVDFDIVAYFNQRLLNDDGKPLKHFSSNRILVEDPFSFARINYSERQYDTHQIFWELENPLRRHQSAPNFVG
jgi:hypothetical protein